jgi:hypothetical protein
MKLRSRAIAVIVAVLALLIVGTNAYGWVEEHRSLPLLTRQVNKPPTTAIFVPKQAPAVISLLANPEDLELLNRLVTPRSQHKSAHQALRKWERRLFDRLHLDYHQEIAPWLGEEITLAVTSLDWDRNPDNGSQPGYLLAFSSRHPQTSSSKIQAWWDKQVAAERLELSEYQGVKIGYNQREHLASALVADKYVLFANHPKILREGINNLQTSNLSILDLPDYQRVLAAHNHHKIGVIYGRLPELERWLGKATRSRDEILGINFGVDRQGLVADAVFYPIAGTPPATTLPTFTNATTPTTIPTLHYLPRTSTIAIAGNNLTRLQPPLTDFLANYQKLAPALDLKSQLKESVITSLSELLGFQLPPDLLNWVTGDYAIAALPNPSHNRTDWAFIVARTQPEAIDTTIAHLDELAAQAGYEVGLLPWENHQVIGWTKLVTTSNEQPQGVAKLIAQVPGVHTTVEDKYTILASSVEAMDSTLKAIEQQSLLESDRYRQATHLIAATETGYLYGNWHAIAPLLPKPIREQKILKLLSEAIFSGLPNISLSSTRSNDLPVTTLLLQP